jgi:hypothetical protein
MKSSYITFVIVVDIYMSADQNGNKTKKKQNKKTTQYVLEITIRKQTQIT